MLAGNILCVISCFLYAVYTISINICVRKEGGESNFDMPCFIGFIGVYNAIICFLLLFLFDNFGWERFAWPPDVDTWLIMTMYAVSGFMMVYCWAKSTVFLGPGITCSFYAMMTFPFVIWFDIVVVDEPIRITAVYYGGSALILVVFIVITFLDWVETQKHQDDHFKQMEVD